MTLKLRLWVVHLFLSHHAWHKRKPWQKMGSWNPGANIRCVLLNPWSSRNHFFLWFWIFLGRQEALENASQYWQITNYNDKVLCYCYSNNEKMITNNSNNEPCPKTIELRDLLRRFVEIKGLFLRALRQKNISFM